MATTALEQVEEHIAHIEAHLANLKAYVAARKAGRDYEHPHTLIEPASEIVGAAEALCEIENLWAL